MKKVIIALLVSCAFMHVSHASTTGPTEPIAQSQFALSNKKIDKYIRNKPLAYQIYFLATVVDHPHYANRQSLHNNIARLKAIQENFGLSNALTQDEITDLAQRELAAKQAQENQIADKMFQLNLELNQQRNYFCSRLKTIFSTQNESQSYNDLPAQCAFASGRLKDFTIFLNDYFALNARLKEPEEFVAILTAGIAKNKTSTYNSQRTPRDLEAGASDGQSTAASNRSWSSKIWALIPLNSSLS